MSLREPGGAPAPGARRRSESGRGSAATTSLFVGGIVAALLTGWLLIQEVRDSGGAGEGGERSSVVAVPQPAPPGANFATLAASDDTRAIADVIVRTGDNAGLPFIVIDKRAASIYVFDADGGARASAPVLLGAARGDQFAPGVAEKDMYQTSVAERVTPAGRFIGQAGINDKGQDVVWIQYDAGIAMHAVLDTPGERRRDRLATATPDDNRISYGCVNLPTDFYHAVVRPVFDRTRAVVYVLPDGESPLGLLARR